MENKKKRKNRGPSHKFNKKKSSKKCRSSKRTDAVYNNFVRDQHSDQQIHHQFDHEETVKNQESRLGATRDYSSKSQSEIYADWKKGNFNQTKRLLVENEDDMLVPESREEIQNRGTILGRKGGLSLPLIIPTGEEVNSFKTITLSRFFIFLILSRNAQPKTSQSSFILTRVQ